MSKEHEGKWTDANAFFEKKDPREDQDKEDPLLVVFNATLAEIGFDPQKDNVPKNSPHFRGNANFERILGKGKSKGKNKKPTG